MSELLEQCKVCGQGIMRPVVSLEPNNYRGVYSYIPMCYSVCSVCRSDVAEPVQIKINDIWNKEFKQKVDKFLEEG